MLIEKDNREIHVTFCSNIFPAQTAEQTLKALKDNLPKTYENFSNYAQKGIGLRLSFQAVEEFKQSKLGEFKTWLEQNNYYVNSLNIFPYGEFHEGKIKQNVYLPDWSTNERLRYTLESIDLLSELSCQRMASLSTSPLGWKDTYTEEKIKQSSLNLIEVAKKLDSVAKSTNNQMSLGLEPEPGCYLENTKDVLDYFKNFLFNPVFYTNNNLDPKLIELVKRHIGICFDTCHFAVMFEDSLECLYKFKASEITISKIQLSSCLSFQGTFQQFKEAISEFEDGIYLHQTSVRNEKVTHYSDTDQIIPFKGVADLRTHFHVPLFQSEFGALQGTNNFTKKVIHYFLNSSQDLILEAETYTFQVLPSKFKQDSIYTNLERELSWVLEQL